MSFRSIIIANPARISLRNSQLVIHTDKDHTVAPEDISALLLESRQTTVTTAALSRLGECGCAVFVCDEKHMPCAILTPFHRHSRELAVLKSQMNASEPRKKRLWQEIVKEKIRNQALCLQLSGNTEKADTLFGMIERVRSGDPDNVEASAAQLYFPALFGPSFTRASEDCRNAALNYGYAILRGNVARYLAVYGFLPVLGLHHRSTLNSFNLADDLMEPFRPIIDLLVSRTAEENDADLSPAQKQALFNCLNLDILSGGKHHSVNYAIEREIQSLISALSDKAEALALPRLLDLKQHRYE